MTDQQQQPEPEPISEYTQEDILQAQEELKNLSPEEYLTLSKYIQALEDELGKSTQPLPEARVVMFTTVYSPKTGAIFHPTIRGNSLREVWDEMIAGLRYSKSRYGIETVDEYSRTYGKYEQKPSPNQPAITPPPVGGEQATGIPVGGGQKQTQSATQQSSSGGDSSGTDVLNKIVIMDDGNGRRVKYYVGKFKYPFSDARDPQTVASVFDADTGFTVAHFDVPVAAYEPRHWGNVTLYADWEKVIVNGRTYYNVVRVHK